MKPILTITGFDQGIVYDDTLQTSEGFNDIEGIDIISEQGVAKAYKDPVKISDLPSYTGESFISSYCDYNNFVGDVSVNGFFLDSGQNKLGGLKTSNNLSFANYQLVETSDNPIPIYSDLSTFQDNSLVFPTTTGLNPYQSGWVGSVFTWNNTFVKTGTNLIRILDSKNLIPGCATSPDDFDTEYWIYLEISLNVFAYYKIQSVTSNREFIFLETTTFSSTLPVFRGYIQKRYRYGVYNKHTNSITTLSRENKNALYLPMHYDLGSKDLYIGDLNFIKKLDKSFTYYNIELFDRNYCIKKIVDYNGQFFVFADLINVDSIYGNITNSSYDMKKVPENNTFCYITNGIVNYNSEANTYYMDKSNLIPTNAHMIDCKVYDNTLYALVKIEKRVALTAFNGTNFETIKIISKTDTQQYPNSMAVYNNSLYFTVREKDGLDENLILYSFKRFGEESYKVSKVKRFGDIINGPITFINHWAVSFGNQFTRSLFMFLQEEGLYINDYDENAINYSGIDLDISYQSWAEGKGPYIISQTYEITGSQFPQLVKGIGILTKDKIPNGCAIGVDYKLDNATDWTSIGLFDKNNQEIPKLNINRRARKIKIRLRFYSTQEETARLIQLKVY